MSAETLRELQAYGYFILVIVMVVVLYGYCYHLYRSEKTKRRNYEKYANLALNDNLSDEVLEDVSVGNKSNNGANLK